MAVDIHFQCGVHSDDAETTSYFAIVGNFLRTKDDLLAVSVDVVVEAFQSVRGWGQGSTGNHVDLVFVDQVEHAILNNFGVYGEVLEVRFYKAMDNSVCYVAYTGLQWEQVFRQSAMFNFVFQEVNQVVAHSFCIVIERSECTGNIWQIAWNDSNDLCRIAWDVRSTYTVASGSDRDRFTVRRVLSHVDISHTYESQRLGGVDFYDDFLSGIYKYRRVANGSGSVQFAVRSDLADFNYSDIWASDTFTFGIGEEASTDLLSYMRQVKIEIIQSTSIDGFSQVAIGLVWHTNSYAVHSDQFAIDLGASGSAGPYVYLERSFFHTFCEFMHGDLRIAAWGESGNTKDVACLNHSCCSFSITDFCFQICTFNSAKEFAIIGVDHYYHPPKNIKISKVQYLFELSLWSGTFCLIKTQPCFRSIKEKGVLSAFL